MNKKQFLKTYQSVQTLKKPNNVESKQEKPLYRSLQDERLIKEMHYAKFLNNQNKIQQNKEFRSLVEKEEWDEDDIKTLLKSLNN
ncbi:hypothetical protein [Marinomonas epiphytica]